MRRFDLDDGDAELGVLEIGDELELVAVDLGFGVGWAWRDDAGRLLLVVEPGET